MIKQITKQEALNRLQQLCSKTEKCRYDINQKLKQWKFQGDAHEIIRSLEEDNFINEERYAYAYTKDKIKFSSWGKNKVKYYLKGKGIPEVSILKALNEFPENEYQKIIEREINKKYKSLKKGNKYNDKQKILAFSAQRGYETDLTVKIVDKLLEL